MNNPMTEISKSQFFDYLLAIANFDIFGSIPRRAQKEKVHADFHKVTHWSVSPSQALDALCFLNPMTADSFYLDYYRAEYEQFLPKITPDARKALANIKKVIKDDNGQIVSASLCLFFSATDDTTLDDMIATLGDLSVMKANFMKTPYYSDEYWQMFETIKPDLAVVFQWLKDIKFEQYWAEHALPQERAVIDSISNLLPKYNVIPEVERLLGYPLASDKITVYMLYFTQPHGIKIVGTRFITDVAWPFEIVVRTSTHEMMHPPFDLTNDSTLINTLSVLKNDPFLMDKVQNHNPSFGYNSFEGFIEEDCVQALDQIINEKLGMAKEPHKRWRENDDAMHCFAISLYQVMKSTHYIENPEPFREFLIHKINDGTLAPGKIKGYYDTFFAESQSK